MASDQPYARRLEKLHTISKERDLDGVILVPGPNLRYYTGINAILMERLFLLIVPKDATPHVVAPTLESGPFHHNPLSIGIHSWTDSEGPTSALKTAITEIGLSGRWGLEGKIPFRFINLLTNETQLELSNVEDFLQTVREVKDEEEIHLLKHAASILASSFAAIPSMIKQGMKESEFASKLAQKITMNGADTISDLLVQTGNSSADPHHIPTSRRIRRREAIVVDATCTYSGYNADITRTFMIGDEDEFEHLYENVLKAQENAIRECQPGTTNGAIDYAARDTLRKAQLDKYFIHRTGHGLGLEGHEAPYLVEEGTEKLLPNMVCTVEPGVYLPSKMGIRIEDEVLITEVKHKVLTRSLPKEYGWWK
jgi:Xaa-Pro aminopeptidase